MPQQLTAGDHKLTLTFGGAIIRDRDIDGPYQVRNIILQQVDTIPPQRAEPPPPVSTPAYLATEFGPAS